MAKIKVKKDSKAVKKPNEIPETKINGNHGNKDLILNFLSQFSGENEETNVNEGHGNKEDILSLLGQISDAGNNKKEVIAKKSKAIKKAENTKRKTRNQRKKAASKMHKQRVQELMESLKNDDPKAKKNLVRELKSIVDENKTVNEFRVSVMNAERLLYFSKNGKLPSKKEERTMVVKQKKKSKGGERKVETEKIVSSKKEQNKTVVKQNKKNEGVEPKSKKHKLGVETKVEKVKNKKRKIKVEESADDDDYNVEENVTVDKVTKKIKEEDSDEDLSDELDESMENEDDDDEEEEEDDDDDDDDEEEEEGDDDDEEEDDDDQDEKKSVSKPKYKKINVKENLKKDGIIQKGQSKYVLFVGNVPFDSSTEQLKEHFEKTCSVKDVRIPLDRNTNKPRGFAYVEVSDETSYQKGLSLHHSQFMNRTINVLYSEGGKKKGEQSKQQMKAKNFKLEALRQKGVLTSDVKKSRQKAARKAIRGKKNANKSQS